MSPDVYWIREIEPLRFGIMGHPRAGDWLEREVKGWRAAGVSKVVSLLQPYEVIELGLEAEAGLCAAHAINLSSVPVTDHGVPDRAPDFLSAASATAAEIRAGSAAVAHCRAGIGRSGLFAACVLSALGTRRSAIFPMLTRARGISVPETPSQVAWFEAHCPESPSPFNNRFERTRER